MSSTKTELIHTLSILLELDPPEKKDLSNLKVDTLESMVSSYIENARKSNIRMVDEHVNHTLPTVGPLIEVLDSKGKWVKCRRKNFIVDQPDVELVKEDGTKFYRPRTNIRWKYA